MKALFRLFVLGCGDNLGAIAISERGMGALDFNMAVAKQPIV